MNGAIINRVQRSLRIQPSEAQKVVMVCLFAFLPSVGGAVGSPGIEALFFARFGVQFLPYMYVALGVLTMVSTLMLTAALNQIPKSRLFRIVPITMAGLLLLARLLVDMDLTMFYPVLWLGMYLFWTLQALFIWGVAGMLFDTRQAKRLFPLFAASSISGNALGGLLTGPLVTWVGTENLLFVWSLMLGMTFLLANRLTRAYDPPEVHYHRPEPTLKETLVGGGKSVFGSPLLRWLSISTTLLAVLLFALAFPFSQAVTLQLSGEDAVAGFLGVFQGLTTAFALLLSLAGANRIFARIGLVGALLVFGLIYLLGFAILSLFNAFLVLVVFRFAQQAWMMGIADTAYQATFNIVPPGKREPARMFVDGVPRQVGVILSGLFLLGLRPVLDDQLQFALFAVLAAACIFSLWQARAAFTRSLAKVLDEGQLHIFDGKQTNFSDFAHDRRTMEVLSSGLESEKNEVRSMVIEILGRLDTPLARRELKRSLSDPDARVRKLGYQALLRSYTGEQDSEIAFQALRDPHAEVRVEGVRGLDERLIETPGVQEQLEQLLTDPSTQVRALAAAKLLKVKRHPRAYEVLVQMAASEDSGVRGQAMYGFEHASFPDAYTHALKGIRDPEAGVRCQALHAIASLAPIRSLDLLMESLGENDWRVRKAAADALASIGSPATETILSALGQPELEEGALLALEKLTTFTPNDQLSGYVRSRVKSAVDLETCRQGLMNTTRGDQRTELLLDSLQHASREHLIRALRAFRFSSDPEKVSLAIAALRSRDADTRANAIELLEALDKAELLSPALQIWDREEQVGEVRDRSALDERREGVLLKLLVSDSTWLRACAAFAAGAGSSAEIRERFKELRRHDPDALVRETVRMQLNVEEEMDPITTLPTMERILFLRNVPLFSELTPEELNQVASIAGEHVFYDGQTFVHEGELGDEMYIIVSGHVKVQEGKGEGREIARRGPGEFVGEMSILTHEPRMASLIADGDVFALCLEQSNFEQMLLEKPEIGLSVMRALIHRLQDSRQESGQ